MRAVGHSLIRPLWLVDDAVALRNREEKGTFVFDERIIDARYRDSSYGAPDCSICRDEYHQDRSLYVIAVRVVLFQAIPILSHAVEKLSFFEVGNHLKDGFYAVLGHD